MFIVRDKIAQFGKGIGYVDFESADSVELALKMGEVKIKDQTLVLRAFDSYMRTPIHINKVKYIFYNKVVQFSISASSDILRL